MDQTITELLDIIRLANQENQENRRKALDNFSSKTSELQPYENSACLKLVGATLALFRELKKKGRGDATEPS